MQGWLQCGVRLATQSLTSYELNICALIFYHSPIVFSPTLQTVLCHLLFLLSGKAVVLPIRITFQRIDSAILKLTLSYLKNIVVWIMLMLSRELTNPIFTEIPAARGLGTQ